MFLIFDTETTGLPRNYKAPVSDSANWPRMVQIAWQLHDVNGDLMTSGSIIIRPEGFTIPFNAEQVHGISTERALREGEDLRSSLNTFIKAVNQTKYLCGHNLEFDLNIIGAEFYRLQLPDAFKGKPVLDTISNKVTEFCAIPGGKGGKYKWPKLGELYRKLFNESFEEAHNAAFDVQATAKAFFELLKRSIINVPELPASGLSNINYIPPDLNALLSREKALKNKEAFTAGKEIAPSIVSDNTSLISGYSSLHNHSQFSVLQCTTGIDELVKLAAGYKTPALALTDHGNMYGAFLFWQSVEKHNKSVRAFNEAVDRGEKQGDKKKEMKAVIGCELYICKDRKDRTKQDNGFTQVFLAKNKTGYRNLSKLSSTGFLEGFYYVPRIDRETLLPCKEGLIATTGSLSGEIPGLILNVGETQAEEAFLWWKEQFGEDFYIELNRHLLPEEKAVNEVLLRFAQKHDVKYFAANTNYYPDKKGAVSHDVLLCVKDGELKETPIGRGRGLRYGFPNDEFYFKSPAEMQKLFSDLPEAISNIEEIVNKIESFKLGQDVLLPKFQIPETFKDENAYLRHLTYEGAKKRYPDLTPELKERLDFELSTIERMGYPGYFLIVSDFTSKAREMDVAVGPGRGSAAGSAIAYCLGITNIDPIKYDLLFERFLNPDRISMPDIDMDFDDEGRDKVIKYVLDKYGFNQVAQIITYGSMGGKSAIRDAARVLNLPLPEADKLAKSFPDSLAASLKVLLGPEGIDKKYLEEIKDRRDIVEQSYNFRKLLDEKNQQSEVLKQAYDLEGCVRNTGIHACGIIITPDEMSKFVPVCKAKDNEMLVTQFDNAVAESAGLLKMDFLGLKTLTIVKDAVKHIKERRNIDLDIDAIPFDDKKTYELFQRGETNGLFQFESAGMQKYLKELKPDAFTDLIAMNALYRPGPMAYIPNYINRKHGREPIVYDLPGMDEFLKETYGITVYQEQVMRLSQKLAGFSKGDADVLRKAMGKKQKDVLDKMRSKFIEGCAKNGHDQKICEKVWIDWEAFASYAFNKSHSTCYAYLAFQTGYLKANYPAEFMASVLTHNMGDIKKVTFFMEECKRMGIKVLGPDVNESIGNFSVNAKGEIRFGMAAIKGVGSNVVDGIVQQRNENGSFTGIFDLAKRLDTKAINKKSLEALSLAGAFDSFEGITRSMFFTTDKDGLTLTEKVIKYGNSFNHGTETNQASLFGDNSEVEMVEPALPKAEPWDQLVQLAREKEVVGFYISGHPLDEFKLEIEHLCKHTLPDLADLKALENKEITLAGIITDVQNRTSKAGKPYGIFILEDYIGSHEFFLFGEDYIKFKNYLSPNFFLLMRARIQQRYNQPGSLEVKINKLELLSELKEKAFSTMKLKVQIGDVSKDFIDKIETLTLSNPGKCKVEILVEDKKENVSVKLWSKSKKISPDKELLFELNRLPGVECELK